MTLKSYIVKRVLLMVPMIFLLLSITFIILHIIPGDPIRALNPRAPEWLVENVRHKLGLDKPVHVQYINYVASIFKGDLGRSIYSKRTVISEIGVSLPATIELVTVAMIISILIGIPLGIFGTLTKGKTADSLVRVISLGGFSIPVFWLGTLLQLIIGLYAGLLPIAGRYSALEEPVRITGIITLDAVVTGNLPGFIDAIRHLLLPSIALSIYIIAVLSRMTRANLIETLEEDYVRTARAKGIPYRKVVYKHALRNAILPIFTTIGMYYAYMLGGDVLTEVIFSYPGMGKLLMNSILRRDYPVIQGCVIVYSFLVVSVTTVLDILYALFDPRIRY